MPKPHDTPLSICSYNVKLLLFDAYDKRVIALANEINQCGTDIVCLQECFHPDAYQLLKHKLLHDGIYIHSCNDGLKLPFYNLNSGLCIFSKYRLENVYFETFAYASHVDALSHKGFLCCDVVSPTHTLTVCNTHLQSDYAFSSFLNLRMKQVKQLNTFLKKRFASWTRQPCVLCGDWNIDQNSHAFSKHLCTLMTHYFPHISIYTDQKYIGRHGYTHNDGQLDFFFFIPSTHFTYHNHAYKRLHLVQNNNYTHSDHKLIRLMFSEDLTTPKHCVTCDSFCQHVHNRKHCLHP